MAYMWDARGNLVNDGVFTYTYNAAGRLVQAENVSTTLAYTYTAAGLRVEQSVGGSVTTYTWDTALPLRLRSLRSLCPRQRPESGFARSAQGGALAQVLATSDGALDLYGVGRIGEERNGAWAYPLPDALGSVRQWADASADVTYAASYRPFGEVLEESGSTESAWGFTGEWWDSYLKFVYLRQRWYQVETGRFTSPDPIIPDYRNPQSGNPYAYVQGNPICCADPTGLYPADPMLVGSMQCSVQLPKLEYLRIQTKWPVVSDRALYGGTQKEWTARLGFPDDIPGLAGAYIEAKVTDVPALGGELRFIQHGATETTAECEDGTRLKSGDYNEWRIDGLPSRHGEYFENSPSDPQCTANASSCERHIWDSPLEYLQRVHSKSPQVSAQQLPIPGHINQTPGAEPIASLYRRDRYRTYLVWVPSFDPVLWVPSAQAAAAGADKWIVLAVVEWSWEVKVTNQRPQNTPSLVPQHSYYKEDGAVTPQPGYGNWTYGSSPTQPVRRLPTSPTLFDWNWEYD